MAKRRIVTYEEYDVLVHQLTQLVAEGYLKIKKVYGPPRGGLPIAVHLSHHLNLGLVDTLEFGDTLIVDDVCDTGSTFLNIKDRVGEMYGYTGVVYASLFWKPCSEFPKNELVFVEEVPADTWVIFPWEVE